MWKARYVQISMTAGVRESRCVCLEAMLVLAMVEGLNLRLSNLESPAPPSRNVAEIEASSESNPPSNSHFGHFIVHLLS